MCSRFWSPRRYRCETHLSESTCGEHLWGWRIPHADAGDGDCQTIGYVTAEHIQAVDASKRSMKARSSCVDRSRYACWRWYAHGCCHMCTGTNLVVLVWIDNEYGMISMEQRKHPRLRMSLLFSSSSLVRPADVVHVCGVAESLYGTTHQTDLSFSNPNFVALAHAFGWKGFHCTYARDLAETLQQGQMETSHTCTGAHVTCTRRAGHVLLRVIAASHSPLCDVAFACDGPVLVAIDVDYTDNHLLMTPGPASAPPKPQTATTSSK